jgi:hypothetical protein
MKRFTSTDQLLVFNEKPESADQSVIGNGGKEIVGRKQVNSCVERIKYNTGFVMRTPTVRSSTDCKSLRVAVDKCIAKIKSEDLRGKKTKRLQVKSVASRQRGISAVKAIAAVAKASSVGLESGNDNAVSSSSLPESSNSGSANSMTSPTEEELLPADQSYVCFAAALNVSAAAKVTFWPLFPKCATSFAVEVVLPVPLTPTIRIVLTRSELVANARELLDNQVERAA